MNSAVQQQDTYSEDYNSDARGRGRGSNGRGRGGRSSIRCQVCYKQGHGASVCYNRFNPHYVPPPPPSHGYSSQQGYAPSQVYHNQNTPAAPASSGYQSYQPPNYTQSPHYSTYQQLAYQPMQPFPPQVQPSPYGLPPNLGFPQLPAAPVPWQQPYQQPPLLHTPPSFLAQPKRPPTQAQGSQALLTTAGTTSNSAWYPDSGATHHVTPQATNIQKPELFEGPDQIFVGNGQGLNITTCGSSIFKSPYNPSITLSLTNFCMFLALLRIF